jgi:uncharacterized protein
MNDGLDPMQTTEAEVLPEVVRRLAAEFDPEEIILFGSRTWGQPQPDSDYDLMVIVSRSDERPSRRAARAYGRLRQIGVPIDVIVSTRQEFDRFSGVPASLEAKILKSGVVLYGRGQKEDLRGWLLFLRGEARPLTTHAHDG